ncbi:uncharacterized protein PHACADRAFT_156688 [Phanerochaete carnosa HHB-10118-sp]|uniref:25S rRNA (uridine-N(3))-methyltransferase BMT5-like domain-containing protein n=1 Tax=Phanerochaete carnosa (strain HHB-10118-sp) TaxID=650164 RepID=K5WBX2_PHACS|nr:uncharacterized protein PHACADRAFT_156688 [Phanerochaete carnosa HHB-10118-sp]EKM61438.1 hypothetical protein PHACADRAFT_156688 [Phanerochaete carnosa HHB-10118-sp]
MARKASLKSALSSQQSRLKKKQGAIQAAQAAEQRGKRAPLTKDTKGKAKATTAQDVILPFNPTDTILLIGEGSFSFTRALVSEPPPALQYLPASSVVATTYDTEAECFEKYPEAQAIVEEIRAKGAEVFFDVDATKLEKVVTLRNRKFDKIMWNFPHAGKGIADQDRNILSNQVLLLGFLRSAAHLLRRGQAPSLASRKKRQADSSDREDGESADEAEGSGSAEIRGTILVTLRNVPPYTLWHSPPPPKASGESTNPSYVQLRSFVFHRSLWKGYQHKMTKGERVHGTGTTGQGGEDRTWEFYLKD